MPYATVVKKGVFDAAHKNPGFGEGHKCNRIHGHTFEYKVAVRSRIDELTGLSIDFGAIKKAMKEEVEEKLDHYYLNEDVPLFREIPPSAENIAIFIYLQVQAYLDRNCPEKNAEVVWVELAETPTSSVIIRKEDLE